MKNKSIKNADVLEVLNENGFNQFSLNDKILDGIKTWGLKTEDFVVTWFCREPLLGLEYVSPFVIDQENKSNVPHFHIQTLENYEKNKEMPFPDYFINGKTLHDVKSLVKYLLKKDTEEKVKVTKKVKKKHV